MPRFPALLFILALAPSAYAQQLLPTIPHVRLTTASSAEISHDTSVDGFYTIDSGATGSLRIKGHGNSTWDMPKKPLKLKLDQAESLLGLPADTEWILLANYADKTLMRNLLANAMGARLSFAYTPRNEVVELTLNGVDLGTYVLTEQLKAAPARVNIGSDDEFLIELDQRKSGKYVFTTTHAEPYVIKEPSSPSKAQARAIAAFVQAAEDALASDDFADPNTGYQRYIDVDSFVDWFLVNEILKNSDAANYSSIYFYKAAGEKLKMGPIWDFDLSAGNINYTEAQYAEGWWIRTQSPWFARLFQDPAFVGKVKARWSQRAALGLDAASLNAVIDRYAAALEATQSRNFEIWPILDKYVWPNAVVTGSYAGEVAQLKAWLNQRLAWLDAALAAD